MLQGLDLVLRTYGIGLGLGVEGPGLDRGLDG